MNDRVKLRQVKHSIDSSYCYIDSKKDFRLKVTIYSPSNKEVYSQIYRDYVLDCYSNKKIYFQNIDLFIPINYKVLINVKHTDGNETQRAIYFDEISNNNGYINL